MAASSSSAKFFVHQNQNKANSSSASPAFAADSDVEEFIEFRSPENEAENLEKFTFFNENTNNNEFDNNCRRRRSSTSKTQQHKGEQQSLALHQTPTLLSEQRQAERQVINRINSSCGTDGAEAATATTVGGGIAATVSSTVTSVAVATAFDVESESLDIEQAISTATAIPTRNSINSGSSAATLNQFQHSNSSGSNSFYQSAATLPRTEDNNTQTQQQHNTVIRMPKSHSNNNSSNSSSSNNNSSSNVNITNSNNITSQQQQFIRQHQQQRPFYISQHQAQPQQQQQTIYQTPAQQQTATTQSHFISSSGSSNNCVSTHNMNSSQQTQAAQGNRITFTSQTLPNGTINIGGGHAQGPTIISTSQLPNTTTIKTITNSAAGGGGQQHHGMQHHQVLQSVQQQQQQHNAQSVGATQTQTLVIKSNHAVSLPAGLVSSAPGIVTMTKTINQGNQPMMNSMIPASVVVGMRPQSAQNQQKNLQGNALQRVVIGPQMVGARPQSPAITLSTLTPGQTPALILKTENGFQLLRVGTATSGPVTQTIGTNSTNPTQIRLQTVPAASMATTSSANNIVVNSVSSTNSSPHVFTSQANISLQQHHSQQQQQQQQSTTSVASITGIQQQHHQQQLHQQQQHQQQQQQQQIHQQTQHLHTQPQITQIQTIPSQQTLQQQQQQQNTHLMNSNSNNNNNVQSATTTAAATTQNTAAQGNTKEKCRKFLANLIDLSTREPKPVERNVRNLIQELVNANVEPEEFCDRLERLLNASPQPCLIGFLKKSLPLLRHALFTKELVIEGIKPPPQHVVGMATLTQQLPKIQAQIRPISQNQTTTTIGQTQVRMISPATAPRPIGHTTITKQQGSIRIQGPTNAPRLLNAQIRGPIAGTIQQQQMLHTNASHLQTMPTQANIVQIRTPTSATQINRPATVQIRATKTKMNAPPGITPVKVGQTQIKAISAQHTNTTQPPSLASISNNIPALAAASSASNASSMLTSINSVAAANALHSSLSGNNGMPHSLPTPSLPTVQLPPHLTTPALNTSLSIDLKNEIKLEAKPIIIGPPSTANTLSGITANRIITKTASHSISKANSKKKKETLDKEQQDKSGGGGSGSIGISSAAAAATSFFQQPSISMSSSMYGDDDINDVAAMGGVNLAEESQRILGCTENIGTQIRSCKDEVFLHLPALQARIRAMVLERGLEDPAQDVAVLISHACQERLKNIVEKLAVIAEHRIDVIKLDPRYEVTKDVRGQIKFLEELDKAEQKRHEELEREMLLRAAKSRSKIEDPEQAKMKARAKEMQRAEMEELRQRDANLTALQAIGPRKKLKLDSDVAATGSATSGSSSGVFGNSGAAPAPLRPRIKRVNLRDMLFFMEQERETCRSQMLYKAYLK